MAKRLNKYRWQNESGDAGTIEAKSEDDALQIMVEARPGEPIWIRPVEPVGTYDADLAYRDAAALLNKCRETSTNRVLEHGGVTAEWTMTAEIWSKLVGKEIEPYEAMAMMTANKLVRLILAPKEDHFLDGANYLALAWGVLNASDED